MTSRAPGAVLFLIFIACAGVARSRRDLPTAADDLRRVANVIAQKAVGAPAADRLIDRAACDLLAYATGSAPGSIRSHGVDPAALLDDALAKVRERHPELDERAIAAIGVQAMAASLRNGSRFVATAPAPPRAAAASDRRPLACRVLDERVLYLGVHDLRQETAASVRRFESVLGAAPPPVILDLRSSAGGTLEGAAKLADLFFDAGFIYALGDGQRSFAKRAVAGSSPFEHSRLVVLVGDQTQAGAELVAAAIQDHRRGPILGAPTGGHLRMSETFRVAGGYLSLVEGHVLRPNGEEIDGHGVRPDEVADAATIGGAELPDRPCPGVASPAGVASDPLVRRAFDELATTGR